MAKKDDVLREFMANELLLEMTGLSPDDAAAVTWGSKSMDTTVEALKRLVGSSLDGDPPATVIKNVNTVIAMCAREDKA